MVKSLLRVTLTGPFSLLIHSILDTPLPASSNILDQLVHISTIQLQPTYTYLHDTTPPNSHILAVSYYTKPSNTSCIQLHPTWNLPVQYNSTLLALICLMQLRPTCTYLSDSIAPYPQLPPPFNFTLVLHLFTSLNITLPVSTCPSISPYVFKK